MQIRTFVIPVRGARDVEEEMNGFLRSHRVLEVCQEFVPAGAESLWCFCVRWLEGASATEGKSKGKGRVDYRKILDEKAFAVFAKLRDCRRQLSRDEGIPAYAIFTDEELAGLAKLDELNLTSVQDVPGIGPRKAERYGQVFADYLVAERERKAVANEEGGESVPTNRGDGQPSPGLLEGPQR